MAEAAYGARRHEEEEGPVNNFGEKVSFIWSVADLLRGPYRPNQYKDVMLPMTVLRRLDCVLEPTKDKVHAKLKTLEGSKVKNVEPILCRVTGVPFFNTSRYTFEKLKGDPNHIAANLTNYIKGFSGRAREIIEHFGFEEHIAKLDKADRLFLLVSKFCEIDLHPNGVSNIEMGYVFEELIRRFNEASNEEAGDHFTPREVIRLMVNPLFLPDSAILTTKGIVKTLYDPACGTGGMLSVAEGYVPRAESRRAPHGLRPGLQLPGLRHLWLRHDDQGPRHRQHPLRRQLHGRSPCREEVRLHARQTRPSA